MEYPTTPPLNLLAFAQGAQARQEFHALRQLGPRAVADLPAHRALVEHLCARARS
jgi:hypothetical protein